MAIQIGKYRRPGIFVEEFDNSIITSPAPPDLINTLVVGFSKKGPINTPIRLTNLNDLEAIFGSIDRGLERKGSYFHRTIAKILESTPVYALNLLSTDDTLDKVQYISLSAASSKKNGSVSTESYRNFFNTTGFWKRDTQSFLEIADNVDTIINLTNVADRPISVFIFKSKLRGFDRTLIEWYGTAEKVPPYLNVNEYASDYMVDVIVVGGDWSNYPVLSVDPRWSRYFDASGLRKEMVREFANDRNINLLAYYEGLSLIPYFRDGNGRNIFIESIINRDTDKTGLYCAFDIDLFETDYPTGMVDLIGNTIAGTETSAIDFLSYKGNINEIISYNELPLDTAGNVSALVGTFSALRTSASHGRKALFAEGYIHDVTYSNISGSTSSFTTTYTAGSSAYAVIGGQELAISSGSKTLTVNSSSFAPTLITVTYSVALAVDSTGTFKSVVGTIPGVNPSVLATDIVLGYITVVMDSGGLQSYTPTHVTIDGSGYVELGGSDYTATVSSNDLTIEFLNTAASADTSNYAQYRKIKYFNHLINLLSSSNKNKMTMLVSATSYVKLSLSNVTISNVVTSSLSNKEFTLTIPSLSSYPDLANGLLVLYTEDNELILGTDTVVTKNSIATSTEGVAARYSNLYLDFLNGEINNNDYFFTNLATDEFNVEFTTFNDEYYVILSTTSETTASGWPAGIAIGDKILFPDSVSNNTSLTISDATNWASDFGGVGDGSDGIYAFKVTESVTQESLLNVTTVYDYSSKTYLKLFIDTTDNLNVEFVDSIGTSSPISGSLTYLDVYSNKLNYKQSVDVIYPSGYTSYPNKILVDAARYSEIKIGDFLEAYVDNSLLQVGETPKKLTRVLGKKVYASDTSLVEISCDAKISVVNLGTTNNPDYQTTRYTQIDDYFDSYKAITLSGFKIRTASMPDGTDDRQNEILNLVAKGTPIFNALVNKEAIDFRYVVDSFGLGLTEKSKQQLVDICGDRLDCFGIINMPSMKQFKSSANPSFTNKTTGVLDTSFIAQGGDPESNPNFLYSFGDGKGSTCVGYFLPYLVINDNGRALELPPAMFVATTYIRKHNSNITSIVPWTIAAGVTNGKVTGFDNVEIDFSYVDIENLNQAQMNPIVYKRNRGFVVETENTAQVLYKSALSFIHVREVLIELERELGRMLLDFQWKFNTPDVRAEIKLRADVICEQYVNRNGLYNFFNKCDDENNTSDLIDNQIGVLDTYVEPIKGMGIIVNNITILRTGAIQSGGFILS